MLETLLPYIPSIIAGVGKGLELFQNWDISRQNLDFQKQNLDYQKAIQQQAWFREDTSSQRKMADLKAAGLNPLLAYGMQAQSSVPIHTEPLKIENPKSGDSISEAAIMAMALMKEQADITKTVAETDRITRLTDLEAQSMTYENNYKALMDKDKDLWYVRALDKMEYDLTIQEADIYLKNIAGDLGFWTKQYKIDDARLENIKKDLEVKLVDKNLTEKELDIAAKIIAVEEARFNLDKYKVLGQPSNQAWGSGYRGDILSATSAMDNITRDIAKGLSDKINSFMKGGTK